MLSSQSLLDSVQTQSKQWNYCGTWQSTVGKKLERLTIKIIQAFNLNIEMTDYLREHLADNMLFISGLPGTEPVKTSPEDLLERMHKIFANHPSWNVHVTNPSSWVDEDNGKATVFTTSTIGGYMVDLMRERVTKSSWRRTAGHWKLVEHSFLVGGGITPIEYSSFGAPESRLV